jgi:SAM-dependent methyltransferase
MLRRADHRTYLEELAAPFGPQLPMDQMVVEMNRLFFDINAHLFEDKHPEIFEQLPPIWRDLLAVVQQHPHRPWRMLDFGCGVGFAGDMVLDHVPHDDIEVITNVDFAPRIIEICRQKLSRRFPRGEYRLDLPATGSYNLLLTNAALHHVPDFAVTLAEIEPLLTDDAWWVMGHEPSARFYQNAECLRVLAAQERHNRWVRWWRVSKYRRRIGWAVFGDMNKRAASRAVETGLFARKPSHVVIDRIVDCGVANNASETGVGRGFDLREMQAQLSGRWELVESTSYSFMGIHYEGDLTPSWRRQAARLQVMYPQDGANISAVWRRAVPRRTRR